MTEAQLYVIAYDTPNDARRRQFAQLLDNVGDRVQHSVFEGWLSGNQLAMLIAELATVVDAAEDSVRCYRVCSYCRSATIHLGNAVPTMLEEIWIV